MIFSSPIFLVVFFPLTLMLYFLCGRKNIVLLAASFVFYCWGEKWFTILLLTSILINYFCGLLIDKTKDRKGRIAALFLGVAGNLVILGFFKYSAFLVENINAFIVTLGFNPIDRPRIHLPLGISFFTFQAISYLVDLYRLQVKVQRNPLKLGLYISLFPQLIAGPIVRYHHIAEALDRRKVRFADFTLGIQRLVIGLAKKLLLADTLAIPADRIFSLSPNELSAPIAWFGVLCFTLQIYFDFSGYSDMAIGLGRLFGFKFLENFNYPYISRSITEFWKRWHISLSTWLRDYLFLPVAYSISRKIPAARLLNIKAETWAYGGGMMITMFLGGLWHGASWNFVIWGLIHGFFAFLERIWLGKKLKKVWSPFRHVYTLSVVIVTWVFFRTADLTGAFAFLKAMFFGSGWGNLPVHLYQISNNYEIHILIIASIFSLPIMQGITNILQKRQKSGGIGIGALKQYAAAKEILYGIWLCLIAFLAFGAMASHTHKAFIYFRF